MKHLFSTLLISLLFSSLALAQDADDWYEVEIIFFEHLNPALSRTENWPHYPGQPETNNAKQLLTELGEAAYTLLPKAALQLTREYKKLERSKQHQPLLHLAWRQVVPNRKTPDRIHIFTGLGEQTTIQKITPVETQWLLDEQGNVINIPIASFQASPNNTPITLPLDGIIKISRGRYLHVETDLLWHNPNPQTPPLAPKTNTAIQTIDLYSLPQSFEETQTAQTNEQFDTDVAPLVTEAFRIQGKLRLRSGEVHYLDNPIIGMLILFTPYAPPLKEEKINNVVETFGVETGTIN